MKKIIIFVISILLLVPFVLLIPVPHASYDDGGTSEYVALTYKMVKWNKIVPQYDKNGEYISHEIYNNTSVFWYPDSQKTIDELWKIEINKGMW